MSQKPSLPCLCASVRRASRVLTQIYDEAMRPFGLRSTQFTVLQALSLTGAKIQGELAEFLSLDGTAMTRTMQLLRRRGWVTVTKGKDRRERWVTLSRSGREELARVQPAWQSAQKKVHRMLGEERWKSAFLLSTVVANLPVLTANEERR